MAAGIAAKAVQPEKVLLKAVAPTHKSKILAGMEVNLVHPRNALENITDAVLPNNPDGIEVNAALAHRENTLSNDVTFVLYLKRLAGIAVRVGEFLKVAVKSVASTQVSNKFAGIVVPLYP